MDDGERTTRVLLVDDEAAITANLAPFLERAGFIVSVAEDGEAALRAMETAARPGRARRADAPARRP